MGSSESSKEFRVNRTKSTFLISAAEACFKPFQTNKSLFSFRVNVLSIPVIVDHLCKTRSSSSIFWPIWRTLSVLQAAFQPWSAHQLWLSNATSKICDFYFIPSVPLPDNPLIFPSFAQLSHSVLSHSMRFLQKYPYHKSLSSIADMYSINIWQ